MGVEWAITVNNVPIEEPQAQATGTTLTVVVKNIGDVTAKGVGFYLKPAPFSDLSENPSSNGIAVDWYDILVWGASAAPAGLYIDQNNSGSPVGFTTSVGASRDTAVPLTVGTGSSSDELEPSASVILTMVVNPPLATPSRRLYYSIGINYNL